MSLFKSDDSSFPKILLSKPLVEVLGWWKSNCGFGPLQLGSNISLLIKMRTINDTFLSMRNKFVYSCSIKILALRFNKLLESIFCLLLVVEAFSLQKVCRDAWRSCSQLARGQVNMADEAKPHSSICSTFEALVMQCAVGCCSGELGPVCWPMPASGITVFSASHLFAEHTSQM